MKSNDFSPHFKTDFNCIDALIVHLRNLQSIDWIFIKYIVQKK